jgi:hypothetical protein
MSDFSSMPRLCLCSMQLGQTLAEPLRWWPCSLYWSVRLVSDGRSELFTCAKACRTSQLVSVSTAVGLAGLVGSRERKEFSFLGSPVNLAARVQALTRLHRVDILVTEELRHPPHAHAGRARERMRRPCRDLRCEGDDRAEVG